jgi:hypothetical protein
MKVKVRLLLGRESGQVLSKDSDEYEIVTGYYGLDWVSEVEGCGDVLCALKVLEKAGLSPVCKHDSSAGVRWVAEAGSLAVELKMEGVMGDEPVWVMEVHVKAERDELLVRVVRWLLLLSEVLRGKLNTLEAELNDVKAELRARRMAAPEQG